MNISHIVRTEATKLVQPICPWYISVTDRQTDGRTDGRPTIQGGPKKTGPFLKVNNFARVSGRKACYTSKFCRFCLEESVKVACQCIK